VDPTDLAAAVIILLVCSIAYFAHSEVLARLAFGAAVVALVLSAPIEAGGNPQGALAIADYFYFLLASSGALLLAAFLSRQDAASFRKGRSIVAGAAVLCTLASAAVESANAAPWAAVLASGAILLFAVVGSILLVDRAVRARPPTAIAGERAVLYGALGLVVATSIAQASAQSAATSVLVTATVGLFALAGLLLLGALVWRKGAPAVRTGALASFIGGVLALVASALAEASGRTPTSTILASVALVLFALGGGFILLGKALPFLTHRTFDTPGSDSTDHGSSYLVAPR
jgi:hypothetical protein